MRQIALGLSFTLLMLTSSGQVDNKQTQILEQTIKKYQKKLEKEQTNQTTMAKIAITYVKLRDLQTAIAYYDKLISINPHYNGAFANRGMCKLFLNDKHGACLDFIKSVANGEDPKLIENKRLSEYLNTQCISDSTTIFIEN